MFKEETGNPMCHDPSKPLPKTRKARPQGVVLAEDLSVEPSKASKDLEIKADKAAAKAQKDAEKAAARDRRDAEKAAAKAQRDAAKAAAKAAKDSKKEADARKEEEREQAEIEKQEERGRAAMKKALSTLNKRPLKGVDIQSGVRDQIMQCDDLIERLSDKTVAQEVLSNPANFKTHFFSHYTFDASNTAVADSCRGGESLLNQNQLSVYIMSRLRAKNIQTTTGLLVNHGTGAGKTLIGVLIMLAFWDSVHADNRAWCIMSVSTRKNQLIDNSSEVLSKLIVKYFQFYKISLYANEHGVTDLNPPTSMFSYEEYLNQMGGIDHDTYQKLTKEREANNYATRPEDYPKRLWDFSEHWMWVEKLLTDRIYQGIYDSLVQNLEDVDNSLIRTQIERFRANREKGGLILFTNSLFGRDFASNLWESDADYFNLKRLARRAQEKPKVDSNSWIEKPVEDFVDAIQANFNPETMNAYLHKVQRELGSLKDARVPVQLPEVNKLLDQLGLEKARTIHGPQQEAIELFFKHFLLTKYLIRELGGSRRAPGLFQIVRLELEEDVAPDNDDKDIEAESVQAIRRGGVEDDDKLNADTDAPYFRLNSMRQMEHCVFILDEMQLLFAPPSQELRESLNYERTLCAFKYYRNLDNTFMIGLTATPGFTQNDVRSVISIIRGNPDYYVPTGGIQQALEKTTEQANIGASELTYHTTKTPGFVFDTNTGETVEYLDDPVTVDGNSVVRLRMPAAIDVDSLVYDISTMENMISVADFSADKQFYPTLTFKVHCATLGANYSEDVATRREEFEAQAHAALRAEAASNAQVKVLREMHAVSMLYRKGQQYFTNPVEGAIAVQMSTNDYMKRLRQDLLYIKEKDDLIGSPSSLVEVSSSSSSSLVPIDPSTGVAARRNPLRERKQTDRLIDHMESSEVPNSKYGCPPYLTAAKNGQIKTITPSNKLTALVDRLMEGVANGDGKHYVYCSDPYALFVLAHYLYTISHRLTAERVVAPEPPVAQVETTELPQSVSPTLDPEASESDSDHDSDFHASDASESDKSASDSIGGAGRRVGAVTARKSTRQPPVQLHHVPNPNSVYSEFSPTLKPYTGESLEELLKDKQRRVLRFYYMHGRKTLLQPYESVIPSDLVSATRRGFEIACGKHTYKTIDQQTRDDPKDYSAYENDLDAKVNLSGDIIPIILATGESYKGVDMKGISHIHLLDPFIDVNDLIQLMGRGPRMCSHADFAAAPQRSVRLHVYMSKFPKPDDDDDPPLQTLDWEIYQNSKENYTRVWKPINDAIQSVAYDRDVFEPLIKESMGRIDRILNLSCETKTKEHFIRDLNSEDVEKITEKVQAILSKQIHPNKKWTNPYTMVEATLSGDKRYVNVRIHCDSVCQPIEFATKQINGDVTTALRGTLTAIIQHHHERDNKEENATIIEKFRRRLVDVGGKSTPTVVLRKTKKNPSLFEIAPLDKKRAFTQKFRSKHRNIINNFAGVLHPHLQNPEPSIPEPPIPEPSIPEPPSPEPPLPDDTLPEDEKEVSGKPKRVLSPDELAAKKIRDKKSKNKKAASDCANEIRQRQENGDIPFEFDQDPDGGNHCEPECPPGQTKSWENTGKSWAKRCNGVPNPRKDTKKYKKGGSKQTRKSYL